MTTSVRTFLKMLIGMLAALQGGLTASRAEQSRPEAAPRSGGEAMATFVARVRRDPQLRARFAENPRAVLREQGIDPAPFDVPERLSEAQLERLLADWARRAGAPVPAEPSPDVGRPMPPVAVYGPPPGPPRRP